MKEDDDGFGFYLVVIIGLVLALIAMLIRMMHGVLPV